MSLRKTVAQEAYTDAGRALYSLILEEIYISIDLVKVNSMANIKSYLDHYSSKSAVDSPICS